MESSLRFGSFLMFSVISGLKLAFAMRFVLEKEECLSYLVPEEKFWVFAAFVVIKTDSSWNNKKYAIDLVVKDPSGEQIRDIRDQTSRKLLFLAEKKGLYNFCFINKFPLRKTVDFREHIRAYSTYMQQHAKDEHVDPLSQEIRKLTEALQNVEYEQQWIEALTEHKIFVNEVLSRWTFLKSVFESAALIGSSVSPAPSLREKARHLMCLEYSISAQ